MNEALAKIAALPCELCGGTGKGCPGCPTGEEHEGGCYDCNGTGAKYPEARWECPIQVWGKQGPPSYHCPPNCGTCQGTGYILAPVAEAAWGLVRRLPLEVTPDLLWNGRWLAVQVQDFRDEAGLGEVEYTEQGSGDTPEAAVLNAALNMESK